MSNPVLNQNRFQPSADDLRPGWGAPGSAGAAFGGGGSAAVDQVTYGQQPPAGPFVDGSRMTVGGTILATAVLWILLLAAGAYGFAAVGLTTEEGVNAEGQLVEVTSVDMPGWIWAVGIGGFVLAIAIAFMPKMARFLAPVYALAFGVLLGAISKVYEIQYSGIVLQAIGATVAVFGVMLFLYGTRIIKVTRKFAMVVMGATMGIALMYLVAWVATIFGADLFFWREPSLLGIGVSVVIAVVAALNLALDFAFIENASAQGMPKYMEWYGAFGITVTIVWLYLEMLRLLSLLRD
jgi:uncharacterized YccA/Bax inhibitor family protein